MTFDEARKAGIALETKNSVVYPLGNGSCAVEEPTEFRFYGCDRWVSHVHLNKHDWNDSLWKSTFALANGNGYIRNPLTDADLGSLTNIAVPQNGIESDESLKHAVSPNDWSAKDGAWTFTLKKTASEIDELFGKISIGKYVLKSGEDKSSGWEIDPSKSAAGIFKVANKGTLKSSNLDFYRSKDSLYRSEKSLNNGQQQEIVPLSSVVAQSTNPADTILVSEWAKNPSAEVVGTFKRNLSSDASPIIHPYLDAAYDSVARRFAVTRNSSDIYASRENEIVTLRGSVPYRTADWNISYIQDGMRFKVAEGKQKPIEASMNVNRLQGNTSFFLTYNGTGDITYYRQLDVRIGERVKADKETFVYSMYGNVSVHFDRNAWASDADVTVRTMDPAECGDCDLFRNMAPVGPVLEILPSHVFPEDKEPLVSVDISMQSLKKDGVDYRNLKIYKLDADKKELVPLEIQGDVALLDSELNLCEADDPYSCAFVRINAKTWTFSKFVVLDSLTADSVKTADSIETIEAFSCGQMDSLWMDTLWMGTANGWLEFPYLCTGKSSYLLQLGTGGDISAEHRGASASPIVWTVRNADLNILDSAYRSSVVFYGIDGNTEQKLGPLVKLDSVAPVIESVETAVSENEDGSRVIHVETEIDEAGSGMAQTTVKLFFGGSLLRSETVPGNLAPICDFRLDAKDLYGCAGCRASVKVIVSDKGNNSDMAVRQTERLYPYPSSLVLWYPFGEGSGDVGYEIMTKDDSRRMHMDLSSVNSPWNGRYGVNLYSVTDSASSRFKLAALDSLRPFTFEFNYNAGNVQRTDWSILSFVGKNEWTFGLGTYSRYFLQVGSERFYFNTKREAYIPTHFAVVVNGKNATLYKNGKYAETITLSSDLKYGGDGRLYIGSRNGLRSATGQISNLRLYSSALTEKQIQGLFRGTFSEDIHLATVRAVSLADRNGLTVDQSCSAPGKAYLRQKSASDNGVMTWKVDLEADSYSLYLLHRNYMSEESRVEVLVNGASVGIFKLTSTGLWKSGRVENFNRYLKAGENEIGIRPMGNLGIAALALASSSANMGADQINYGESSWRGPAPKAKVFMKYETVDDKKWAQIRFDLRNQTGKALENARIRYYYKGEGENVNALSFYPGSPMSVVNDAGSVFYAELTLTEAIAAYGTAYSGQGPLIGLHRLTPPNSYFPYWDITDDPSYMDSAETKYAEATGIALLDEDGNLLNEFACYDEDGPMQKAKIRVRAMARDDGFGSTRASNLALYVENTGAAPVNGFEVRYYYRDSAETELDVNWNEFASARKINAGGDLNYASFVYEDVILNAGDNSDYGNGVQFALHHPNWTDDFNADDDPSHYNLKSGEMAEADSVLVLDRLGNLLWGHAPQPKFGAGYVIRGNSADLVRRDGDIVYVNIEEGGYYILETVNAIGVPQKTLFKGSWNVGEHSVTVDIGSLRPSSFIVLRKGSEILSWRLLN